MTTEMTRQEWLEAEIEFARTDVARLQESDDPIQQMYAARRRRDADDLQHELDQLRTAVSLSIRLAGGEIEDDRAPIDVVRDVVARLGDLADEFGANMLVAPAKPGSHVIEVTGSNARTLFEDDPTFSEDAAFVAAARSVIDLAESPWGGESGWERQIEDKAADFSDAGIRAARGFLHALSTNGIRAESTCPQRAVQRRFPSIHHKQRSLSAF